MNICLNYHLLLIKTFFSFLLHNRNMDKTWMTEKKWSPRYVEGVQSFMKFVKDNLGANCRVRCPCIDYLNSYVWSQDVVFDHLLINGIDGFYTRWIFHGEKSNYNVRAKDHYNNQSEVLDEIEDDGIQEMLDDYENYIRNDLGNIKDDVTRTTQKKSFDELLKEAQQELYSGCSKFSKLSFIVKLLHLKVYNKWSNKSFDMLLDLLQQVLPNGGTLPKSHYEARKMLNDLGLGYISIHACKYDCALFWKEFEQCEQCPTCGTSRWKIDDGKGKKIPHKILRYFPLKSRLQRLFLSSKTAADMRWHKDKRVNDEKILRHPADGKSWKDFDKEFPLFSQESRNVRLGLATDGFNPFGNMSNSYSMWPVILDPYNFPPWKCMKKEFSIMSLLIPGPISPGKDIDVYLQPLVDELKELWEIGVETYDASKGENFQMRAALLWTINDFPAYGMMSGWSTKGYMACPTRNKDICSLGLRSKICYMGHRRFLPSNHSWRKSKKFNGKTEHGVAPIELSGDDILLQLEILNDVKFGKHPSSKKRKRSPNELNWTKKSIFFNLPYWHRLKLRHNLDVMHIQKNICDSILGTLLNIEGKTKDTFKARQDLEDMNIRKELHLIKRSDGKYVMPATCYTLSKAERQGFCEFLKSVKFRMGMLQTSLGVHR